MATTLNLVVDQRYSYREALKIAYDKARQEGGVDEETEAFCEYELSKPSPAAVYHESEMTGGITAAPDGGIYFKSWGLREVYEQARINARRCVAESLSNKLDDATKQLADGLGAAEVNVPQDGWNFSIDETGSLEVRSPAGVLTPTQRDMLMRMLNESDYIRRLALDYAEKVASLTDCTLEGLSAPYARHFSAATTV